MNEATSRPAPDISVWVELNTGKASVVDAVIRGIEAWGKYPSVSTMIVSTVWGNEDVYDRILPACRDAGVRLIPGIKTSSVLPEIETARGTSRVLDDLDGWATISAAVSKAAYYAESTDVIIEGESAVIGHTVGEVTIDVGRMAACFRLLPFGLHLIWHPTITSGYADRAVRQAEFLRVLLGAAPCALSFCDLSISRPSAYHGAWATENRQRLLGFAGENAMGSKFYQLLYCYGPGSQFWSDEWIASVIAGQAPWGHRFVLYPGAKRFADAAASIGPMLDMAFATLPRADTGTVRAGEP